MGDRSGREAGADRGRALQAMVWTSNFILMISIDIEGLKLENDEF